MQSTYELDVSEYAGPAYQHSYSYSVVRIWAYTTEADWVQQVARY